MSTTALYLLTIVTAGCVGGPAPSPKLDAGDAGGSVDIVETKDRAPPDSGLGIDEAATDSASPQVADDEVEKYRLRVTLGKSLTFAHSYLPQSAYGDPSMFAEIPQIRSFAVNGGRFAVLVNHRISVDGPAKHPVEHVWFAAVDLATGATLADMQSVAVYNACESASFDSCFFFDCVALRAQTEPITGLLPVIQSSIGPSELVLNSSIGESALELTSESRGLKYPPGTAVDPQLGVDAGLGDLSAIKQGYWFGVSGCNWVPGYGFVVRNPNFGAFGFVRIPLQGDDSFEKIVPDPVHLDQQLHIPLPALDLAIGAADFPRWGPNKNYNDVDEYATSGIGDGVIWRGLSPLPAAIFAEDGSLQRHFGLRLRPAQHSLEVVDFETGFPGSADVHNVGRDATAGTDLRVTLGGFTGPGGKKFLLDWRTNQISIRDLDDGHAIASAPALVYGDWEIKAAACDAADDGALCLVELAETKTPPNTVYDLWWLPPTRLLVLHLDLDATEPL